MLQTVAVAIRLKRFFNISLVLVRIVVGAALYGYKASAWLGFVFRMVVQYTDVGAFLAVNVPETTNYTGAETSISVGVDKTAQENAVKTKNYVYI